MSMSHTTLKSKAITTLFNSKFIIFLVKMYFKLCIFDHLDIHLLLRIIMKLK